MELFKNIKEFPEYIIYSDGRILTKKETLCQLDAESLIVDIFK